VAAKASRSWHFFNHRVCQWRPKTSKNGQRVYCVTTLFVAWVNNYGGNWCRDTLETETISKKFTTLGMLRGGGKLLREKAKAFSSPNIDSIFD
jgi:hypothetical protein